MIGPYEWPESDLSPDPVTQLCPCGSINVTGIVKDSASRVCGGSFVEGAEWEAPNVASCQFDGFTQSICDASGVSEGGGGGGGRGGRESIYRPSAACDRERGGGRRELGGRRNFTILVSVHTMHTQNAANALTVVDDFLDTNASPLSLGIVSELLSEIISGDTDELVRGTGQLLHCLSVVL